MQCYYTRLFAVHWQAEVKNDFVYHYSASAGKPGLNIYIYLHLQFYQRLHSYIKHNNYE